MWGVWRTGSRRRQLHTARALPAATAPPLRARVFGGSVAARRTATMASNAAGTLFCGYDSTTVVLTAGYCLTSSMLSIINKFAVLHFPYPAALTGLQYITSAASVYALCANPAVSPSHLARLARARRSPALPSTCIFLIARAGGRGESGGRSASRASPPRQARRGRVRRRSAPLPSPPDQHRSGLFGLIDRVDRLQWSLCKQMAPVVFTFFASVYSNMKARCASLPSPPTPSPP